MVFKGNIKLQKSFRLAAAYLLAIFASLYFTPYFAAFLQRAAFLKEFIDSAYVTAGILFVVLSFYKYRIFNFKAYFLFSIVLTIFLWEFWSARLMVERFHYLEYGLLYALWFRVVRHFVRGRACYLAAFVLCSVFGLADEVVQFYLPNRHFDWGDVWMNVVGCGFGAAVMAIFTRYRRDKRRELHAA